MAKVGAIASIIGVLLSLNSWAVEPRASYCTNLKDKALEYRAALVTNAQGQVALHNIFDDQNPKNAGSDASAMKHYESERDRLQREILVAQGKSYMKKDEDLRTMNSEKTQNENMAEDSYNKIASKAHNTGIEFELEPYDLGRKRKPFVESWNMDSWEQGARDPKLTKDVFSFVRSLEQPLFDSGNISGGRSQVFISNKVRYLRDMLVDLALSCQKEDPSRFEKRFQPILDFINTQEDPHKNAVRSGRWHH